MENGTKEKKKPARYPDVQAMTRCLRQLEGLDPETRARVAKQVYDKCIGDLHAHQSRVNEEYRRANGPMQGIASQY